MFDPVTAQLLQSAPSVPGLDSAELPARLTEAYSHLVAARVRGDREGGPPALEPDWDLVRIADTYEVLASLLEEPSERRAAAFVSATAQQILARDAGATDDLILTRDAIDPRVSATVMFLASRQYADAAEAAKSIPAGMGWSVEGALSQAIARLASGRPHLLPRDVPALASADSLVNAATTSLYRMLLRGLIDFADLLLSGAEDQGLVRAQFERVERLATDRHEVPPESGMQLTSFSTYYAGPFHLARILQLMCDEIGGAATSRIPAPPGADSDWWHRWLLHRARATPFLWPNHEIAVQSGFHMPGSSAVLVLPTGAGKTTVSCLKIATVLARGGSVVFIVPTNALADQLAQDLKEVFPEELLGDEISAEFDALLGGAAARRVEVMTPERCLAVLSYAPDAMAGVDLLVFDECHMLDRKSDFRRSLDAMFCILAFRQVRPDADFLLLSAMLENGSDLASWLAELTDRPCQSLELVWKPSRQARGVVLYDGREVASAKSRAMEVQSQVNILKRKRAKGLRSQARKELELLPMVLFGLRNNWRDATGNGAHAVALQRISSQQVTLNGVLSSSGLRLTPNCNQVAAAIASDCVAAGLKTIVFSNQRGHAELIAREINHAVEGGVHKTDDEDVRWRALEAELGGLEFSLLPGPRRAVIHHSQLLRLERELSERMFRRPDGASVIVATPTLAQGLNLPAEVAILAGDQRFDMDGGSRELMEVHEVLNAAARAGRAGHLANGLVLLVPDAVLTISSDLDPPSQVLDKLEYVLPPDDRCVMVTDPLEYVLDQVAVAGVPLSFDMSYAINRLASTVAPVELDAGPSGAQVEIGRSLGAFMARRRGHEADFAEKVERFNIVAREIAEPSPRRDVQEMAARSGLAPVVIEGLISRVTAAPSVPETIADWSDWMIDWLWSDTRTFESFFAPQRANLMHALGAAEDDLLGAAARERLKAGVRVWLTGQPIVRIEDALGGGDAVKSGCSRARQMCLSLIPMALAGAMALVSEVVSRVEADSGVSLSTRSVVEAMPRALRLGFDTPQKLAFYDVASGPLSRVQFHLAFPRELAIAGAVSREEGQADVFDRVLAFVGSAVDDERL